MDGPLFSPIPYSWTQAQSTASPEEACKSNPTIPQCQAGIYSYVLNRPANATFLLFFIMLALPLMCIVLAKRRAYVYSAALFAGLVSEILGYAARYWSSGNQLQREPFYLQLVCLTVGPAFMAASIYFCMRRVVAYCGQGYSVVGPEVYTRLVRFFLPSFPDIVLMTDSLYSQFIPCDLVSLILQATGGAIAAAAHRAKDQPTLDKGTNIMIAGLAFQVFTMLVFISMSSSFATSVIRDYRRRVQQHVTLPTRINAIRTSPSRKAFRVFIFCIFGSTLLIFIRCYYRVVELSGGWKGTLMKNQALFVVCEGVFILFASLLLIIGHPTMTASMILDASGDFHSMRQILPLSCSGMNRRRADPGFGLRSMIKDIGQRATAATPTEIRPSSLPQNGPTTPPITPPITPVEDLPVLAPSQRESQPSAIVPPIAQPPPVESSSKHKLNLNFLRACIEGDFEYVRKELADRPQSLEACDWVGNSPLQIAAKNGQYKMVKLLMDKGCNIHGMNLDRDTPLLDAADNRHLEVVKLLLDAGVNPSQANVKNQKPFDRVRGESERAHAIRMALTVAEKKWASVADVAPQTSNRQRERPLSDLSVGKL